VRAASQAIALRLFALIIMLPAMVFAFTIFSAVVPMARKGWHSQQGEAQQRSTEIAQQTFLEHDANSSG
jgi:lipopolysaccharide export LptBFGC system permease protein LptF